MIPSRSCEVNPSAKKTQIEWDSKNSNNHRSELSSESCKSNSTTDFPSDISSANENDNAKDAVSASCKINKTSDLSEGEKCSEKHNLSQEIAGGSSTNDETLNESRKKINNSNSTKKRFFDLKKFPDSAKKTFSSKLKLPNRVSLTLSPRKASSPHNKLSLSQLEQQNNLFIRDGQQQSKSSSEESTISKQVEQQTTKKNSSNQKENEGIDGMEQAGNVNPKQKQDNLLGAKSKKASSSLIPSFLGGGSSSTQIKNVNHIKIPSTSLGSIKKAPSTQNVVEKLTKTGNKFKELYRDFPSTSSNEKSTSLKRNPPPYRPPPTPPNKDKNQSNNEKQKRLRFSENEMKNYEEIEPIIEVTCETSNNDEGSEDNSGRKAEEQSNEDVDGMISKAEYSSNVFKNIPVRPRKGIVSHMENYCLFDPSVDFCNEKELMKKKLIESKMSEVNLVRQANKQFQLLNSEELKDERIEDVTFEDQTVYDVSELDEREKILAHHNYYEIDPDLLLEEDEFESVVTVVPVEQSMIAKDNQRQVGNKMRKSKIYSNTLSTSSESTSTSQTSTNSSSTSTSSDYPSLFNSVIETTHSSTVESTDDNESNGYGKAANDRQARENSSQCVDEINQTAVGNESLITISNVVTCGESNASSTGATKKKSPQLNRIIRPSSSSTRNLSLSQNKSNKQQTTSLVTKTKTNKINFPIQNKSQQLDPLKSSHSLPQLQNIIVQNRCRQQTNKSELNFVIDNTTTIQLRRQHSSRQGRPLSGHSDDRDSGFLSPVTPPDNQNPAHITPNVIIKEAKEQNTNKSESTLLNQCDNIQQLIEVSNDWDGLVTHFNVKTHCRKMRTNVKHILYCAFC
ncbi:CLUMA_CG004637, isoform A [Clunio marinus]|uniref:CLUMA_CG004637, isoform A n=1 Tax=Clunio marinus TaxID=568069 RepID=A0A1J1HUA4_9DIPT|nr:CLUMA_CG004637, isoform A [Clunio marinus]